MKQTVIAIHGGAGTIERHQMDPAKEKKYRKALEKAVLAGSSILESGGTAMDAVAEAVRVLEDCPLFNAGKGAVFSSKGTHELDASIMDGSNLEAGAIAGVVGVKNPIDLARLVMDKSQHVFLCGQDAVDFGQEHHIKLEDKAYFYDQFRYEQYQEVVGSDKVQLDHTKREHKFGTVGAVALDQAGNIAAATSTGGMTNKKYGRIGDSSVIGAGTYANNNTCAVSCTGHGEFFIRSVVAYDVSCLMEYAGMTLQEATEKVVQQKLVKIGGEGGLIAVDANGNCVLPFNSEGMYRAMKRSGAEAVVSIYKDEE